MSSKATSRPKLDELTQAFIRQHGDDCSHVLLRWWQAAWYTAVLLAVLVGFVYRWDVTLACVTVFFSFWYFSIVFFRATVVTLAATGRGMIRLKPEDLAALNDAALPVYTILVPLYREENIADKIVRSIRALDYPRDKLDVKLLLEEDDTRTIEAVRQANLESHYDVIVVPHSHPKTKPKACNHGLRRARGEFCVIFDAEDRPDPDQLRKVVCAFRQLPDKVACIQAKLNFYNARQNLLTRWFTIEYSTTFDLFLPGLQFAGIPMPLGGTSNHFRTAVLQSCGGWDPFNVTEDCDLGVRIYRMGFVTRMIDSTTWEEANPHLWNWIRQRSRWVKGFFQTHLTHLRNPWRTMRQLGPWGTFGFVLSVGGSSLMMTMNVLYWLYSGVYVALVLHAMSHGYGLWEVLSGPRDPLPGAFVWPMVYHGPLEDPLWSSLSVVFFAVAAILFAANFFFVYVHCLACLRRGFYRLLPFALLMPAYWVLISIGAWKGFFQLLHNPFYWEKTVHGLAREPASAPQCRHI
jgi:cellulose synthase/poly-beta-1,6-N-acetylglucosamine synthase-like glycosyltransferase